MNRNDLATQVAAATGLGRSDAGAAVDAMVEAIAMELAAGREVAIAGFGKFSVSRRAARTGRNPATGTAIPIAASSAPKFSAAAALKRRVNV